MYNFGERLRLLRISVPLSQKQLATRIGVAPSLISAYENGRRFPPGETLICFSHLFHVSIDYLVGQDMYTSIRLDGLTQEQILFVAHTVEHLRQQQVK